MLDEWPLIRLGVAKVLADADVRVVADASDGAAALAAVRAHQPDVLVIGGHAGEQSALARQALAAVPGVQCIVLVPGGEERDMRFVMLAGARAVVPRAVDPDELRDVVRRVLAGDHVVSPSLLPRLFEGNGNGARPAPGRADDAPPCGEGATGEGAPPADAAAQAAPAGERPAAEPPAGERPAGAAPVLTVREREIVRLLGAGRSNAEIAAALFVSGATVKTHLAHIYDKLGVRTRYDALGRAVALGLLD